MRLGSAVLVFGMACSGLTIPPSDTISLGPTPLLQSIACLELLLSALDLLKLGLSLLVRSPAYIGLACSTLGLTRVSSVFSLFAVDTATSDFSLLIHGLGRPNSLAFILDFLHLDFFISMRSLVRCSSKMPAVGVLRLDLSPSVSDHCTSGPFLSSRSPAHFGLALPVFDLLHLGFPMSAQCFCWIGLALSVFGKFSFGQSSVSVMGRVMFDFSLSVRSSARFDSLLLILDFLHLELSLLLRNVICFSSSTSVCGLACCGLALLLSDFVNLGLSVFLQSMVWIDLALPLLDFLHLGFPSLARQSACFGSSFFAYGLSRFSSALLLMDHANVDFFLSPHSSSRLGFIISVFNYASIGSAPSLQDFGRLESVLLVLGVG